LITNIYSVLLDHVPDWHGNYLEYQADIKPVNTPPTFSGRQYSFTARSFVNHFFNDCG